MAGVRNKPVLLRRIGGVSQDGCESKRLKAFLRALIASLQSSLNHGLETRLGEVRVLGIVFPAASTKAVVKASMGLAVPKMVSFTKV